MKFKDFLKPTGKVSVAKVFVNKRNGQMTVILPKKKMNGVVPKRVEITYW